MKAEAVDANFTPYHNGSYSKAENDKYGRRKPPPVEEREIIAWDMEGMNLSGDDKPQHPVLFGSSKAADEPLISRKLTTLEMLNYIIETGNEHPHAIHVGYGFKYDTNMILQDLTEHAFRILWKKNRVRFFVGGWYWNIQYYPGKKLTITRQRSNNFQHGGRYQHKDRTTVTIHDYVSFFGGAPFVKVCEDILRDELTAEDREIIEHGKAERGTNQWVDLPKVRYYWQREIVLIERVFRRFRDIMCQAGFALKEWYGPGALANAINTARGIRAHLAGAQSTSGIMPLEVHEAFKIAFSGGRFEPFQLGRIQGPIHAVDINSAYPFALTLVPSLAEGQGEWKHESNPTAIRRFGVYRVEFTAPNSRPIEQRPMPLFWRNAHGLISYPNRIVGWYASPEARTVLRMPGVRITEGWYWDTDESERPWQFLNEMYATRQRLGKGNLLSLPFKLGPNSLYGKYAQTVGWNEQKKLPPKSHALPVAAWVTSMCRSMLWEYMKRAPESLIAVETDSIYTTASPEQLGLPIGTGLGQWSHSIYEEIVYLQSGMYLTNREGEWTGVRSRGIGRTEFPVSGTIDYLQSLIPGQEWGPLRINTKPRFISAGAALGSASGFKENHCTWQIQTKEISFGDSGKRRHSQRVCRSCADGMTPWDGPHRTFVHSQSDGYTMSAPRRLPWEQAHTPEVQEIRDAIQLESELVA